MRKPLYQRFRKLLSVFGNDDSISYGKNIFEQINVWILKSDEHRKHILTR